MRKILAIAAIPLLAGALMVIVPEALAAVSATEVALGVDSDITVVIPSLATPATLITITTTDAIIGIAP